MDNEEIKKPSFLVYYDNEIVVLRLPDEEAGKLFKSLFPYGKKNIKPDFEESPALAMAFDILSMAIDRDKKKYAERCEKNKENGRKGGLAKANKYNQSLPNAKSGLANLADKDRDKDRDMDKDRINYQQIADMYNNICMSFPRLIKLSESRKKAIRARLKTYSAEDFRKVFEMAESSSFLKGQNDRNWSATFDWMLKDSNFAKILDGNYQDKDRRAAGSKTDNSEENPYSNDWVPDYMKNMAITPSTPETDIFYREEGE